MESEFHDEIDALVVEVEATIESGEEFLSDLPEFNPKYRRMAEAEYPDPADLFG